MRRFQGSLSSESATQATAAQAVRRTPAGQAEAGRAASAERMVANVVLTQQDHQPQRRRLPRQAGKRAQRQRSLRQVRHASVPGICSSWDLPVRDDSDEKPCISFMAKEVQPAAKPAKARVEEKGPGHPIHFRQQRWRDGELAPGHLLRVLS